MRECDDDGCSGFSGCSGGVFVFEGVTSLISGIVGRLIFSLVLGDISG